MVQISYDYNGKYEMLYHDDPDSGIITITKLKGQRGPRTDRNGAYFVFMECLNGCYGRFECWKIFWHFVFPVTFSREIGLAVERRQDRFMERFFVGSCTVTIENIDQQKKIN